MITLTTDFGSADHFVGAMKGVILTIAPRARIVDITHEITPYQISEGAFVVAQAWRYFPKGSIHVVVVDPGVGSARRPILAQAGGHYFIAPDNGVLSMVYDAAEPKVRIISNVKMMSRHVSRTFHGRDIFAPAAAHLARGAPAARFGNSITDYVHSVLKPELVSPGCWRGAVLKVDRFGNLITNFQMDAFAGLKTRPFELRAGSGRVRRLALTFSDAPIGDVFAIVGSSGYIEVAANQASAAQLLSCGAGAPVELELSHD